MTRLLTLLGAAIAVACALAPSLSSPHGDVFAAGPCAVADASNDGEELAFLATINAYRANNGLAQLSLSAALNRAAEWMVQDMIANDRFGHTDSTGRGPFVRTVDCGYPIAGGENLAAGSRHSSAGSAFELFRNSPPHNENMLAPEYRQIGIARAYGAGTRYGWYWATTFGAAGEAAAPAPQVQPAPQIQPAPQVQPPLQAEPAPQVQPPLQAEPAPQLAAPPPEPEPPPPSLDLVAGAQLVTWSGPDIPVSVLLSGHETEVSAVWAMDPESGAWTFYMPELPEFLNTLLVVKQGAALWVVARAPTQLVMAP